MKLFISYGHEPPAIAEFAHRLVADLRAAGHDPWIDSEQIHRSSDWRRALTEALHGTEWTVGLLSRHALREGGITRQELVTADDVKGGCLTTILIEPLDGWSVPPTIGRDQWIDMADWQQRLAADAEAYAAWYAGKLGDLLARLEPEIAGQHSLEMAELRALLDPVDQGSDRDRKIEGFVGRQWLVEELEAWRLGHLKSRMFWLHGAPGTGKSAFAAWITATHQCNVVALNLCDWRYSYRREPERVISTLAWQAARRVDDYRLLLRKRLDQLGLRDANGVSPLDRLRSEPAALFDQLLVRPLHDCIDGGQNRERLLVVIDGLDEVQPAVPHASPGPSDHTPPSTLVDLLRDVAPSLPAWVALMVTGRHEEPLVTAFAGYAALRVDAAGTANRDDIDLYVRGWLEGEVGSDPAEIERLVAAIGAKAAGNFMYVRMLRDLRDNDSDAPLDPATLPDGLRGLYWQWMQRRFRDVGQYRAEIAPLLELIAASVNPVPEALLRQALYLNKPALKRLLEQLGGLLEQRDGGWVIFHKSLQDWLCDTAPAACLLDLEAGVARLNDALWVAWLAGPQATMDVFLLAELPFQVSIEARERPAILRARLAAAGGARPLADRIDATIEAAMRAATRMAEPGLADGAARIGRETAFRWWDMASSMGEVGGADWLPAMRHVAVQRGDAEVEMGSTERALAAYRNSLAIADHLAGTDPGNGDWNHDLSVSHNRIGDVLLAAGDRSGASDAYRAAMAIRVRLAASDAGNPLWQRAISVSHEKIGNVLMAGNDRTGALEAYSAGLEIAERLAGIDPENLEWQRDLSISYSKIGNVQLAMGLRADALKSYRADLAIAERLVVRDPGNAVWRHDLSISHTKIGNVLMADGDRAAALKNYRAGMEIRERLAASDPGSFVWQRDLSASHSKIGNVLMAMGDRSGALAAYRAGTAIARRLAASDPGNAFWQRDLSVSHVRIGNVLMADGDRSGALDAYRSGMVIAERLAASDSGNAQWQRDLLICNVKLGEVLWKEDPALARRHLAAALRLAGAQFVRFPDWPVAVEDLQTIETLRGALEPVQASGGSPASE